jgi:hypothetical protein
MGETKPNTVQPATKTNKLSKPVRSSWKRWLRPLLAATFLIGAIGLVVLFQYHQKHPLVFGESFLSHEHCITQASMSLQTHASDHGGRFPFHTNGFGDALLLVQDAWLPAFSGPGHSTATFENARANGTDVSEAACGRIYVQGLSKSDSPEIAILFDRTPSPGDHLHGFARMTAPPVREVAFIGGSHTIIPASEWAEFAKTQIELLVAAGIPRTLATSYYSD